MPTRYRKNDTDSSRRERWKWRTRMSSLFAELTPPRGLVPWPALQSPQEVEGLGAMVAAHSGRIELRAAKGVPGAPGTSTTVAFQTQ